MRRAIFVAGICLVLGYLAAPAMAVQLSSPGSTMVQCESQNGGNNRWYLLSNGQSVTVGCMTSTPVHLDAHETILVRCGNAGPNRTWTPLSAGQKVTLTCGNVVAPTPTPQPTSTPTPQPTPTPLPPGVPEPPAIPPVPTLNNPTTIAPGTHGVKGDGVTDDTAAWQTLLNAGDVIVKAGTYAIGGNLTIPTGRNISCEPGAVFLDTQSYRTRMFQIGYSSSSEGNNSIVGCTFQGTDYPAGSNNFVNYKGGTSGYSELFEIASGWGVHTDNVLIENNTFVDGQGDYLVTYSPCGTANKGSACNGGAPGTEGPSNVTIYDNSFSHCGQPAVHLNGGQNLHAVGNTFTDCNGTDEQDSNVLQVITSYWDNNTFITTNYGSFDALNGQNIGSRHSCNDNDSIPSDGSGCWSVDNILEGQTASGRGTQLHEGNPTCAGKPGNYSGNELSGGAYASTGC